MLVESSLNFSKSFQGLTDATVYLLERTGDVGGALSILLQVLETNLVELGKYYDTNVPAISETSGRGGFYVALKSLSRKRRAREENSEILK